MIAQPLSHAGQRWLLAFWLLSPVALADVGLGGAMSDTYHRLNDQLQRHAQALDRRLSGRDQSAAEANLGMDLRFEYSGDESFTVEPDVELTISLPATRARLRELFGKHRATQMVQRWHRHSSRESARERAGWRFDVGLNSPDGRNDIYAEFRQEESWRRDGVQFRHGNHIGYGDHDRGYLRHELVVSSKEADLYAPVALTNFLLSEEEQALLVGTAVSLYRSREPGQWEAFVWAQRSEISSTPRITGTNVSRRRHWPLWQDKLFVELGYGVDFSETQDWELDPFVAVTLRLRFFPEAPAQSEAEACVKSVSESIRECR